LRKEFTNLEKENEKLRELTKGHEVTNTSKKLLELNKKELDTVK